MGDVEFQPLVLQSIPPEQTYQIHNLQSDFLKELTHGKRKFCIAYFWCQWCSDIWYFSPEYTFRSDSGPFALSTLSFALCCGLLGHCQLPGFLQILSRKSGNVAKDGSKVLRHFQGTLVTFGGNLGIQGGLWEAKPTARLRLSQHVTSCTSLVPVSPDCGFGQWGPSMILQSRHNLVHWTGFLGASCAFAI